MRRTFFMFCSPGQRDGYGFVPASGHTKAYRERYAAYQDVRAYGSVCRCRKSGRAPGKLRPLRQRKRSRRIVCELLPVKWTVKKYKTFSGQQLWLLAAFYAAMYCICFSPGVKMPGFLCTHPDQNSFTVNMNSVVMT